MIEEDHSLMGGVMICGFSGLVGLLINYYHVVGFIDLQFQLLDRFTPRYGLVVHYILITYL